MTLTDLYAFITMADTSGLDENRAAAIATIRSLIGSGSPIAYRMYPDILDEGCQLPALTYQLISETGGHDLDASPDGLYFPLVQIDVWANSALDRWNLGLAVKEALDGFAGTMVGTTVDALLWDNNIDSFESDRKQYRRMMDFRIIHNA